eukprot:1186647-Prorocentrum_minimum.AAC.2
MPYYKAGDATVRTMDVTRALAATPPCTSPSPPHLRVFQSRVSVAGTSGAQDTRVGLATGLATGLG